jgi:hypothetical protein
MRRIREKLYGVEGLRSLDQQLRELGELVGSIPITEYDILISTDVLLYVEAWVNAAVATGEYAGVQTQVMVVEQEIERLQTKYGTIQPPTPGAVFAMFPFCIPWDVMRIFQALAVPPVEPRFEFDITPDVLRSRGSEGKIVIDISMFEGPRQIVRNGFLIAFIIGLAAVTKRYIWTGGG